MDFKKNNTPFFIRDVTINDIEDLYELASILNSLNLPKDKKELERIIYISEDSFSGKNNFKEKEFLFVLVNENNKVIGSSQIMAKHGTLLSPHLFFSVDVEEYYSKTLNKYFRHKVLKFGQNFDGPTEIGSLILLPFYRGHKPSLGKFLSYVRFLFMGMKKELFSATVIAELLPSFKSPQESALFDEIGAKFTGLSYAEADKLSRHDKDFIISLFPKSPLYVNLLSKEAQAVIGEVGELSKGAEALLSKIGFYYNNQIDPFDGGPHYVANLDEISIIKNIKKVQIKSCANFDDFNILGMYGFYNPENLSGNRFLSFYSPCFYEKELNKISIPKNFYEKVFKVAHELYLTIE